jgi:hypothetical protein
MRKGNIKVAMRGTPGARLHSDVAYIPNDHTIIKKR